MIDTRLKTLIVLSENGSYTKTAEILGISQPAVSQHIKGLETEFNVTLLSKTEKGIVPTPQGNIIIRYAKRSESLFEVTKKAIEESRTNIFSVTVGVTSTSESSVISEALGEYALRTPGVHIRLSSFPISEIYAKLESYEIDLAIIQGHNSDSRYRSLLLETDSLMLAVSSESPWAKKSLIRIEDIKKLKLILRSTASGLRQQFESALKTMDLSTNDFNVVLEVDDLSIIKTLVEKNFGVSILPRSICLEEENANKIVLLPIEGMSMIQEVSLVYPKDFEHQDIIDGIAHSYQTMKRK